jgi:hypothetical protein
MVDRFELGSEFFARLEQEDEKIARKVAEGGCLACGRGALHRSDYSRKPRGRRIAPEGDGSVLRFSLCCDREGCRKRATPPSLRFLGRRVYLGAVVVVASMFARVIESATELRQVTGVPVRTTRRWLGWWGGPFVSTSVFVAVCARLIGVAVAELPASIVLRLPGSPTEQVGAMLALLAPLTTSTVRDGARFLRGAA